MDNIKEKLVELLKCDPCPSTHLCDRNCNYAELERCFEERFADHLIANGVTIQRWISVEERLPFAEYGESDDVLAVTKFGLLRTLYFDGGNWCFQSGECCPYKITHWMPLPPAPKGE